MSVTHFKVFRSTCQQGCNFKMQSAGCNLQDEIGLMQFARCNLQDVICKMQFVRSNLQDAICKMQFARCNLEDAPCRRIKLIPAQTGNGIQFNSSPNQTCNYEIMHKL